MAISVTISDLRKNVFDYLTQVTDCNDTVYVSTRRGNAVILSEKEYERIMETVNLLEAPGRDKLHWGLSASMEDGVDFQWKNTGF